MNSILPAVKIFMKNEYTYKFVPFERYTQETASTTPTN